MKETNAMEAVTMAATHDDESDSQAGLNKNLDQLIVSSVAEF